VSGELQAIATAPNEADAAIVLGRLEEAGIRCLAKPPMGTYRMASRKRAIYVRKADLQRARTVLEENELPYDEAELARLSEEAGRKALERARGERHGHPDDD
jgi:Putative prokaryotic signal transducing protein